MFIRKADLSDLDAITELDEAFGEELGEPVYSEDQWYNFINGDESVFCCQGDDSIIGILLALENHDGSIQLQKIFVAEEFRDQDVGHYLMDQFLMLQQSRHRSAFLCVATNNTDAQRFYDGHGFVTTGDDGFDVQMTREPD